MTAPLATKIMGQPDKREAFRCPAQNIYLFDPSKRFSHFFTRKVEEFQHCQVHLIDVAGINCSLPDSEDLAILDFENVIGEVPFHEMTGLIDSFERCHVLAICRNREDEWILMRAGANNTLTTPFSDNFFLSAIRDLVGK